MRILTTDKLVALVFMVLTLAFLVISMTNQTFFDWAFDRHHNQWSWYIRPLFVLPYCYFAYTRSWSGISITVFALFTSMFWFNPPTTVSEEVKTFLQFEKDWLQSEWNLDKWAMIITVPLSMFLLALAFWKKSLLTGLAVVALMATGKIIWSILNAGDSGKSILIPATVGLVVCLGFLVFGFRKMGKKSEQN